MSARPILTQTALSILEKISQAVFLIDRPGRLIWVNQAAGRFLGYSQDELLALSLFDLEAGLTPSDWADRWAEAGRGGVLEGRSEHRTKEGLTLPAWWRAGPVKPEGLEGLSLIVTYPTDDITGRKQAEEELRKAEEKYRLIAENTSDFITVMTFSLDPVYTYFSPSHKSLGYDPDRFIGKSGRELIHPDDIRRFRPLLKRYVAGKEEGLLEGSPMGPSEKIEFRVKDAAGNWRWLESTVNPVKNEFLIFVSKDITERKLAAEAQRRSEKKYDDIFHHIQDVYYEVTLEGEILEVSPSIQDFSGYKREDLIGKSMYDLYVDPRKRDEFIQELLLKKKVADYEIVLKDKNRTPGYGSINAKLVCDEDGRPTKIIGSLRNITRLKQAEAALRESEEIFHSVFAESSIGLGLFDAQGRLLEANRAALDIFGVIDPAEVKGFDLFSDPSVSQEVIARLPEVESLHFETVYDFERVKKLNQYQTKKSGTMDLDVVITRLGRSGRPAFTGYLVHVQDVTARKRTEEQIRILSQELLRAQEAERQRIARELHDHVAQDLSTLKIGCETLFNGQESLPLELRRKTAELSERLAGTIRAVRELAYDLNPAGLDRLGLIRTVRRYCRDFSERTGINVEFHSVGLEDSRLDFHTEINLFRLIQEGLNNIRQHAGAGRAAIRLAASFPEIILRIEDDGRGFDVEKRSLAALKEKRLGLTSMVERVKLLGGRITIKSRPGDGTLISIKVPFQEVNHVGPNQRPDR